MLRRVLVAASLIVVVAACSSEDPDPCPIVGTYTTAGTVKELNCELPPAYVGPPTVEITRAPSGINADFAWTPEGASGMCLLHYRDTCRIGGTCAIIVPDATTATTTGTLDIDWTFDDRGFHGTSTLKLPPAQSVPIGCTFVVANNSIRR